MEEEEELDELVVVLFPLPDKKNNPTTAPTAITMIITIAAMIVPVEAKARSRIARSIPQIYFGRKYHREKS